jgi:hypothetical protein
MFARPSDQLLAAAVLAILNPLIARDFQHWKRLPALIVLLSAMYALCDVGHPTVAPLFGWRAFAIYIGRQRHSQSYASLCAAPFGAWLIVWLPHAHFDGRLYEVSTTC